LYFFSLAGPLARGETFRYAFSWVPFLGIDLTFLLDGLSLLFCLLITGIGTLVVVYSGGYLAGHPELGRFHAYILMFMASMLGVVLSDNAIALFVFWELTSLSSFFLIGFDHEREAARVAALQALLVTGLGGLALMAGFLLMGRIYGSLELTEMLAQGARPLQSSPLFVPILLLLLAGAYTKSAQFPFHIWLPNAMEAPAPVSTYLHAATMVKAGIYLMARVNPLFAGSDAWFWMLVGAGAATMLIGAWLAMVQSDLKRILAYSTVSALGTLTLLLGLGTERAAEAAMAYLLVHGLYKGALFLTAGAVDHGAGTRDVRELGGLRTAMPLTALAAGLAALSMAGIFPFFGFIGKETIYAAALEAPNAQGFMTAVSLIANLLFVAIGLIVGIRPFFGELRKTPHHPHEGPVELWAGPLLLGSLGLAAGFAAGPVGHGFVQQAASAVLGRPLEVHLALWHGWSAVLALSLVTLASGLLVFAVRRPLSRGMALVSDALGPVGPAQGYFRVLDGTMASSRVFTRLLQSGYLNRYLLFVLITTVGLAGFTLFFRARIPWPEGVLDVRFYEAVLVAVMLAAALAAVRSRSRLATVIALGVVGYGVGLLFLFFGAPDLAMTQILVETLTVILFVLVFYRMPYFEILTRSALTRAVDLAVALASGALMTGLILAAVRVQWQPSIASYFSENSLSLAHGHNIVNVILVDFRGFDTLGEITVLSVAGIGVYALLKLRSVTGGAR
jgi:multicomponent Na+:H+ antiporter subunit A